MRKFLPIAILLQSIVFLSNAQTQVKNIETIVGKLEKITSPVKSYESFSKTQPGIYKTEVVNEKNSDFLFRNYGSIQNDPALQRPSNLRNGAGDLVPFESTVIRNWDGASAASISPSDPSMAAGPNHVVQMINAPGGSFLNIWNKTGTQLVNNVLFSTLHSVTGAGGDPIVAYDKLADRWLLSEFTTTNPYKLVILISKTNDPTGQYYVYSYSFGADFPDYPKYSVWPNAYYATTNNFPNLGAYGNSSIVAFDRVKMLAGDPTASLVKVTLGSSSNGTYFRMSPVTFHGGANPGAADAGMFTYMAPEEFTTVTTDVDSVGIIFFNPNFTTPASSTYSIQSMVAAPYNATVDPSIGRDRSIPQPGTAIKMESLSGRIMNQPVYRDFGTHKSIYMCHVVGLPGLLAGIRWYELRNTGSGYNIYQQGTYSPDNTHRFMPSISVNKNGEMAIGYMASNGTNVFPGLRFAGRRDSDPLGTLTSYEETSLIEGTLSQTQNPRAGDYCHLQVDPADDTTFWFTGQYFRAPSLFGGYTRVGQFDLALPLPWDARTLSINSPANNNAFCSNVVTPNVTIKNSGINTITSLTVFAQIDNGTPVSNAWTGSLALGASATIDLSSITTTGGTHTLKVYTSKPNGNNDQVPANDTAQISFTVLVPQPGPIVEGFESTTFPSAGWRVINPNTGSLTWERTTLAAKTGVASTRINFWNYATTGHLDFLLSPIIDAANFDTAQITFDRAYRKYNTSTTTFNDTLSLQISTDCGTTFPLTVWKKGGSQLATNATPTTANWVPAAADWVTETVDIRNLLPANTTSFTVSFTGRNSFGQNLYLDNINIKVTKALRRDATLSKIIDPFTRVCTRTLRPVFEYGNKGVDTLKSVKINYILNGGPVQTRALTGLNLASGKFATDSFPSITLAAAGANTLKVYTSEPNGLNDQLTTNDTTFITFNVFDPVNGPIKEGFESTAFPPANWGAVKSNTSTSWERNTRSSSEGTASAWMRNRILDGKGAKDELYSPLIQISNVDSVFVLFDVAHVAAKYPGSTAVNLDSLEILLTKDCGKTFTSIYRKWGEDLQTTGPNFPGIYPSTDLIGFVPQTRGQWRKDSINISSLTGSTGLFQLIFRNINNFGNNTFLDNININPVTLPAKLKQQGYMISPNPSDGLVFVQHYLRPTDLRGIDVISSNGQAIWQRAYNGNASSLIPIDLNQNAAGIYTVRLKYTNKVVIQRIIKVR
jgi:hypothetical protein